MTSTIAPDHLSMRVEREIVATFRKHRALSGAAALRLRDMRLVGNPVLKRMLTRGLIRRAGPERYFLDEPTFVAERNRLTPPAKVALGAILVGIAVVIILSLL